jgi:transposase
VLTETRFDVRLRACRAPAACPERQTIPLVLEQQPLSGHVFVLRGRRGDIVKRLWFDGDGLCLLAKRLERWHFVWPQATGGTVSLSRAQLSMLLEGIDWRAPLRTAPAVWSV